MLNTPYIGMIRETIRLALRLRLDYYKFNWYLVGTENGYRYAAKHLLWKKSNTAIG